MSGDVRRLWTFAAAAFAAFGILYLIAVQTHVGQHLDTAAFAGGERAPQRAQDAAGRLLRTVSVGGLLIAILLLGIVAAARRRPALVFVPAAVIGSTMIAVELFKHVLLDRPQLLVFEAFVGNSYPSGHTATAISVGLAAVIVSPPRLRPAAAALAFAGAAGFGVFVVTAGWHLPSDAIGAYTLALAVSCAAMAILYSIDPPSLLREHRTPATVGSDRLASGLELAGFAAAACFFVGVVLFASLRYGPDINWTRIDAAYLAAMAAIVVAAALTVSFLLRALPVPAGGSVRRRDSVPAPPG